MKTQYFFKAKIYKTGINWAVDVPRTITKCLTAVKGYIKVKGSINGFRFSKSLVPVKDAPYRLFVNAVMMKGGNTAVGKSASFQIEQDKSTKAVTYRMPKLLITALHKHNLANDFNLLTPSRKKDILRYLMMISKEETLVRNINKVIAQLRAKKRTVRIP